MRDSTVLRLFPTSNDECALDGLYLGDTLEHAGLPDAPFVYTNFISSLDGRVAADNPRAGRRSAPPAITNPRDWRLFQELAARSDALLVSAAFLRGLAEGRTQEKLPLGTDSAFNDLHDWRAGRGMPPQPAMVVLGRSLDRSLAEHCKGLGRRIFFALGDQADRCDLDAVEATGASVLIAGVGQYVEGKPLIEALSREGFQRIYSIAGPRVLHTLLRDRVLDRLYLTYFHRLLGGPSFDTLLEGEMLDPPASFALHALYYDIHADGGPGQLFAAYDVC